MDVRSRRARESSPDRAKVCVRPRVKPIKRVQVVYYISRNGQLEHPHYMEVTHSANQPLRLRDVIDRLTALRGKGMPSLYSWSCKRSYKNGYVWNDLAENDIIYPAEGAEYVLKGSELVEGCSESFRQLIEEPKRKPVDLIRNRGRIETEKARYIEEQEYEVEEEYEDEEKTSFTSSTTTNSRCSRGVSTDEPEDQETHQNSTESTHRDFPPPLESAKIFDKPKCRSTNTSKRFEDVDPATTGSEPGRNSVLLQLIACGNFAGNKGKTVANPKQPVLKNTVIRTSSDLQKGVLRKTAMKVVEEEMMINCISENPRFGSLQSEEKEYFSGSIVESMSEDRVLTEPGLKRSNSYNEERSAIAGLGESRVAEEANKVDKAVRAKCIPMKKPSSSRQNKK